MKPTSQAAARAFPGLRYYGHMGHDQVDFSHEVRTHKSRIVRLVLAGFGTMFVGIGLAGAVLPVLPTTPFMLLAAGCYVRASPRFYNWLLNTRAFGPLIREWRQYRSIPWKTKLSAIALMTVTLSTSIVFFVEHLHAQVAMSLFGCALAIWLYRIPSRDRGRVRVQNTQVNVISSLEPTEYKTRKGRLKRHDN